MISDKTDIVPAPLGGQQTEKPVPTGQMCCELREELGRTIRRGKVLERVACGNGGWGQWSDLPMVT